MRSMIVALGSGRVGGSVSFAQPAAAKKSKMGCEIGKEIWDAVRRQVRARQVHQEVREEVQGGK